LRLSNLSPKERACPPAHVTATCEPRLDTFLFARERPGSYLLTRPGRTAQAQKRIRWARPASTAETGR